MSAVPHPRAVDGAVAVDMATRTLTVVPAEPGYSAMLWRDGYEALVKAGGTLYGVRDVWAHAPGRPEVARGELVGGALKFTFRRGDPAWSELVGTPGLRATVVVDWKVHRILNVSFHGRR